MYSRNGARDDRAWSPEADDYPVPPVRHRRPAEDPRQRGPPPSTSGRGSLYDEDMAAARASSRPIPSPRQTRAPSRAPPPRAFQRGYSYDDTDPSSEYERPRPRPQGQLTSDRALPSASREPARHREPYPNAAPPPSARHANRPRPSTPPVSLPYRDGPPEPRQSPSQGRPRPTRAPIQGGGGDGTAASRAPAAAPSGDTEIVVEIRDTVPLVPNDDLGMAVHLAVKLALDLHADERAGGFDALVRVGEQAVRSWRRDGITILYQGRGPADMRVHARAFLGRLRRHFFKVVLMDVNKGYPEGSNYTVAVFDPATWTDKAQARASRAGHPVNFDTIFRAYDPRDSGEMQINTLSVEFLATSWREYQDARSSGPSASLHEEAYESFLACMSLTIAHEMVHAFLTFLAGSRIILTPTDVAPEGEANELRGESGRMWEYHALGGLIAPQTNKDAKFESQGIRAGALSLLLTDPELEGSTRVTSSALRNLAKGRFSLPLATEGFKSLSQLRRTETPLIVSEREWRRKDLMRSTARSGTSSRPRQSAASSSGARGYDDYHSQGYSTRRFHVEFLVPRDDSVTTSEQQQQPVVAGSTTADQGGAAPLQTGTASGGKASPCKQRPALHKLTIPENVLFSTPPVLITAASPSHSAGTATPGRSAQPSDGAATPTGTKTTAQN